MSIYDYIIKENVINGAERQFILDADFNWTKHSWTDVNYNSVEGDEFELSIFWPDANSMEGKTLHGITQRCVQIFSEKFPDSNVTKYSSPRLNKYSMNTQMDDHVDHINSLFDGNDRGIPILSMVGVFNDNYEGGEFVFNDDHVVNLRAGDVLMFPSVFLFKHRVNTVTDGTRFSFVSWGF